MAKDSKKLNKNLSITELKKQSKKLDERTDFDVIVGDDIFNVAIDNKFRKTKQHRLLDDLIEFFNEGNNKVELLDLATPYTTLLFIKHFTSVDVSDDIDEAMELLNVLIDLDLLSQILNLMPEQEVIQVYEILSSTADRMKDNIQETLAEVEKVKNQVENDEVKELYTDDTVNIEDTEDVDNDVE